MNRSAGFDGVAWFYDSLARVVFGRSMVESQTHFLSRIGPGSSVLILGGGTGWILDELFARAGNCEVWYIDSSEKMLSLASRRRGAACLPAELRVPDRYVSAGRQGSTHFIRGSWQNLPAKKFDFVVTNYFLDLFTDRTLGEVIQTISSSLKEEGTWLVTDFTSRKHWHRIMLGAMYLFFRLLCRIETATLPAWEEAMAHSGFEPVEFKFNYGGFMKSVLFKR